MHVLHFYKTCFPDTMGGVQKFIDQLAISTLPLGVTHTVLALTSGREKVYTKINGYEVYLVPQLYELASTPFSFEVYKLFKNLIKKTDIIHYHFPWPFADLLHSIIKPSKPTILTYHSDIIKQKFLLQLYKPLMNNFLNDITKIVATSPNYLNSSKVLSAFSYKTSIIPLGLDRAQYPQPTPEKLNYWSKIFNEKFFLFIGVLRYYKGLHFLVEAAKHVKAPILILGSGKKIEEELKIQAKKLQVNNIHFLGELPDEDKIALLALAYAFVFPSHLRSEAFGFSLLEGAMFGKPLISCEIGTGTSYINIANDTGLIIPPGNYQALAQAMQFLLSNPKQAQSMGLRAATRYQNIFTAEKMALEYSKLYKDLIYSNKI